MPSTKDEELYPDLKRATRLFELQFPAIDAKIRDDMAEKVATQRRTLPQAIDFFTLLENQQKRKEEEARARALKAAGTTRPKAAAPTARASAAATTSTRTTHAGEDGAHSGSSRAPSEPDALDATLRPAQAQHRQPALLPSGPASRASSAHTSGSRGPSASYTDDRRHDTEDNSASSAGTLLDRRRGKGSGLPSLTISPKKAATGTASSSSAREANTASATGGPSTTATAPTHTPAPRTAFQNVTNNHNRSADTNVGVPGHRVIHEQHENTQQGLMHYYYGDNAQNYEEEVLTSPGQVILFTTSMTGNRQVRDHCRQLETLLYLKQIPHHVMDVADNAYLKRKARELYRRYTGDPTMPNMPILCVDDRFVGNYEAVQDLEDGGELDERLARLGVPEDYLHRAKPDYFDPSKREENFRIMTPTTTRASDSPSAATPHTRLGENGASGEADTTGNDNGTTGSAKPKRRLSMAASAAALAAVEARKRVEELEAAKKARLQHSAHLAAEEARQRADETKRQQELERAKAAEAKANADTHAQRQAPDTRKQQTDKKKDVREPTAAGNKGEEERGRPPLTTTPTSTRAAASSQEKGGDPTDDLTRPVPQTRRASTQAVPAGGSLSSLLPPAAPSAARNGGRFDLASARRGSLPSTSSQQNTDTNHDSHLPPAPAPTYQRLLHSARKPLTSNSVDAAGSPSAGSSPSRNESNRRNSRIEDDSWEEQTTSPSAARARSARGGQPPTLASKLSARDQQDHPVWQQALFPENNTNIHGNHVNNVHEQFLDDSAEVGAGVSTSERYPARTTGSAGRHPPRLPPGGGRNSQSANHIASASGGQPTANASTARAVPIPNGTLPSTSTTAGSGKGASYTFAPARHR